MRELRRYLLLENTFLFWNFVEVNFLICQNREAIKTSQTLDNSIISPIILKENPYFFKKMHVDVDKVSYCDKYCMFQLVLSEFLYSGEMKDSKNFKAA